MRSANSFSPIGSSAGSSYTPYLMEDFLYEKPFVNLALNDSKTMDSLSKMNEDARESSTLNRSCFYGADVVDTAQLCEIGLYGADGKTVDMARERNYSAFKASPLKFHSSSDWSSVGIKMDRWERVDGLKPDGSENPGGVPIRHVERYNMPAITVDNWIEKYSFVVDDLMPHRLRQIRMNFNFNEEIAWECDIAKPENASDACEVYKRKAGESWPKQPEKHVPHPVKKNGQFDFVPADYGYNNLLAIQKDDQNTVTISTVNKIGLSNTQRFYYLYKATDNVLKSNWPVRDVVLNNIEGFEAFASVTNYQGFKVDSAYDVIYVDGDIGKGTRLRMDGVSHGEQDLSFLSRQFTDSTGGSDSLDEGQYAWQFKAFASDLSGTVDSSQFYNALFSIDRTAPKFSLRTDNGFVNPDSAIFLVRYKWADTLHGPDIRAMRWTLEGGCTMSAGDSLASDAVCSGTVELPAMHDVAANEFAVAWDKVPQGVRNALEDGLYRVKAYAVDYAVPNRVMYDSVNALVGRIMQSPGSLKDADWKFVGDSSGILNDTAVYALFRIDRTPPVIKDISPAAASAVDTAGMSFATGVIRTNTYAALPRPQNAKVYPIVSEDSLLEISYKVVEKNSGVDIAAVLVSWCVWTGRAST